MRYIDYISVDRSELNYLFASQSQLNCTAAMEDPNVNKDYFYFCDENGSLVDAKGLRMERFINRLWTNFARTGDPNNEDGFRQSTKSEFPNFGSESEFLRNSEFSDRNSGMKNAFRFRTLVFEAISTVQLFPMSF